MSDYSNYTNKEMQAVTIAKQIKNVPRHFPNIQDKRGASTHPRVQSSSTSFIYVPDYFVLTFSASGCHAVSTTLSTVQSEVMIPAAM